MLSLPGLASRAALSLISACQQYVCEAAERAARPVGSFDFPFLFNGQIARTPTKTTTKVETVSLHELDRIMMKTLQVSLALFCFVLLCLKMKAGFDCRRVWNVRAAAR
jgi:hypothetical protein